MQFKIEKINKGNKKKTWLIVSPSPNGKRSPPVSISRNCPITCIRKPIMESLFFHKRRHPISLLII